MKRRVLVIAPHADDEVLGCGATVAKMTNEEHSVYVLIMTNAHVGDPEMFTEKGIEQVRKEALEAHSLLGVTRTFFLDFPAPALDQFPAYKMSIEISKFIKQFEIDTVFVPHRGDIHIDHRMVFNAALVSCRPVGNYSVKNIYAYETLSETEWAAPFGDDTFIPNYFVSINEEFLDLKLKAMSCFQSQLKEFPSSRSLETIEALAKFRGSTINKDRAEAFMLIRQID
jgi:LmbE family N-acetylglucosaminyl deacetylase